MRLRLEDKRKAIDLRQRGYSYSEIRQVIPNLSKGTLSGWLKNIELSPEHKERILKKIIRGSERSRLRGAWTNKQKADTRIQNLNKVADTEYQSLAQNELFKLGLSLYWAEGAKKSRFFQFMNSDPKMINFMIRWLIEVVKAPKEDIKIRIFIHKIYLDESCEKFWSEITNIPAREFKKTIYKPTIHTVKKNPGYKGCCRIEITKSEVYWKIARWIEILSKELESERII